MTKVSTDLSDKTYTPAGMDTDTDYYWQVVAKNFDKTETASSPVWTFKTAAVLLTLVASPSEGGTCSGDGTYSVGQTVEISATANAGYAFSKWSSDSAGSDTVSTDNPYSYTVPSSDTTLYAIFTHNEHALTVAANPSGGGTAEATGSNPRYYNDSITVSQTTNADYCFVNWTDAGDVVKSRRPSYTFTMPDSDLALTANYVKAVFYDGFEGMETATSRPCSPTVGIVDMNWATGNAAANGDLTSGNPWWGDDYPTMNVGHLSGIDAYAGSNALWDGQGTASGCQRLQEMTYLNLAYRFNGGSAFTGNLYLDWRFYDPRGTVHTASGGAFCDDPASLCYTSNTDYMPTDADYNPATTGTDYISDDVNYAQKLSLGCTDASAGSAAYYQARIKAGSKISGAATAYAPAAVNKWSGAAGWYNLTNTARTVGWHHCRIVVGPADGDSNTVAFYIDDMDTAQLVGTATGTLYSAMQLKARGEYSTGGWWGAIGPMYDEVSFGVLPAPPEAAAATDITDSSITWNWTEAGAADGFHVWTEDVGGTSATASGTSYVESATANTAVSRWVSAYLNQYAGDIDTVLTALGPVYTLAANPTYGESGDVTIQCDAGSSNGALAPGGSVTFTFNNEFGDGAANVGQFGYIWDTNAGDPSSWAGEQFWTSGATLEQTLGASGSYYLHIRSYNNDSTKVAGGGVLNLGPYEAVSCTPVGKISDLWPLSNGPYYCLTGKTVTGVVGDSFWIEETDRCAAVKVAWTGTMPVQDHTVDVTGALGLDSDGQRVLTASAVTDLGAGTPIKPLGVVEKSAGGSAVNGDTPSISGGKGLYNIGMLVRIAGAAGGADTSDPNNQFFYLDDGSGLTDGPNNGIKVLCGSVTPPSYGDKTVTGLVGVVGGKPVIVIRDVNDLL